MCNNASVTYTATIMDTVIQIEILCRSVTYRFTELVSPDTEVVYECTREENPSSLRVLDIQDNLAKLIIALVLKNLRILSMPAPTL